MASEMTWYDRNVEGARRAYEAALEHREKILRGVENVEERLAAEETEKARKEKALAILLKRLSLSYEISHPDSEGGEEETVETVKATFDFALDRDGNSAVFQGVRGPPSCGHLIQLPVKLSHVTKLFRSLGSRNLEPFEVQGVVRCGGANHRAQIHEGTLKFAGYKEGAEDEAE